MNRNKGRKGLIFFAIILVVLLFSSCMANSFTGKRTRNPDSYTLDFTRMSQRDTWTMKLESGDVLEVSYEIHKGHVDLFVDHGEEILLQGNNIENNGYFYCTLNIKEDGNYRVVVEAKNAAGSICVKKK